MSTERTWRAWSQGDSSARDALLQAHLSLVHHVTRQLSRALAAQADIDEMVSCGTIGLIEALEAYDPSRGLAFSTFAVPRIRGAILDELRRQDHVPRSVRRKTRQISQARETLGRVFGRPATDAEMAEHLGIDLRTLWRWQGDTESAVRISLHESPDESTGSGGVTLDALSSDDETSIDDAITREQEAAIVRDALKNLKEQERTVLSLYYFEDLKLHEIAEVLGVTESRVSQIRSRALTRLRSAVGHLRMAV